MVALQVVLLLLLVLWQSMRWGGSFGYKWGINSSVFIVALRFWFFLARNR